MTNFTDEQARERFEAAVGDGYGPGGPAHLEPERLLTFAVHRVGRALLDLEEAVSSEKNAHHFNVQSYQAEVRDLAAQVKALTEELRGYERALQKSTKDLAAARRELEALREAFAREVNHGGYLRRVLASQEWTERAVNPEQDDPSDGCYECGGVRAIGHQQGCAIAAALAAAPSEGDL